MCFEAKINLSPGLILTEIQCKKAFPLVSAACRGKLSLHFLVVLLAAPQMLTLDVLLASQWVAWSYLTCSLKHTRVSALLSPVFHCLPWKLQHLKF